MSGMAGGRRWVVLQLLLLVQLTRHRMLHGVQAAAAAAAAGDTSCGPLFRHTLRRTHPIRKEERTQQAAGRAHSIVLDVAPDAELQRDVVHIRGGQHQGDSYTASSMALLAGTDWLYFSLIPIICICKVNSGWAAVIVIESMAQRPASHTTSFQLETEVASQRGTCGQDSRARR